MYARFLGQATVVALGITWIVLGRATSADELVVRLPPVKSSAPANRLAPETLVRLGPPSDGTESAPWSLADRPVPDLGPAVWDQRPSCLMNPCVYGGADYLYLHRVGDSSPVGLLADDSTDQLLLDTRSLGTDHLSGVRAWLSVRLLNWVGVEFGYLGYFNVTRTVERDSTDYPGATLTLPGDLGPASHAFFDLDRLRVNYASQLNSYEFHFVTCHTSTDCLDGCPPWLDSVEWLAGVRYLALDERLALNAERDMDGSSAVGNYVLNAQNDLYGAQLGVRARHGWRRFSFEGLAKAGLFVNQAQQAQSVFDDPGYYLRPLVGDSRTELAFVGEVLVSGVCQLSANWGLRVGYALICLNGMALAPDQLDYSVTPTSGQFVHHDGSIVLHGLQAGLEGRW